MAMTRREQRSGFPDPMRIGLLENDADQQEQAIADFRRALSAQLAEFESEIKADFSGLSSEVREEMRWSRRAFVGMLISMTVLMVGSVATILIATAGGG